MLCEFGPGLWLSDGPSVSVAGFHYPTRMALVRLADGSLFIWSPIRLNDALKAAIEGLGPVSQIVAPNGLHHLSLPEWVAAFPRARVHAAPRLRKKRHDIAFHADLGDLADPAWAGLLDQVVVCGNLITDEVVFFHRPSRTALFTDLLQQFPDGWFKGWRALVARADLMVGREPAVPRKFRLAFFRRSAARASLATIRAWPVERVVMAHGQPVERDGAAFLARAFGFLGL
jgi:hypothetical protein